jgi:hypothetical protein
MTTEQTAPVVDSVSSAIDAMDAKLFGAADETPEPEAAAADESPEQSDDEAPQEDASPDGDLVEIESDDGETFRVPPKLRESFLRRKDYTEKTQRLAVLQESAQDKADYLAAREQVLGQVVSDVAEFRALQTEHARYQALDWQALYNADPGQALKLRDQRDQLERQLSAKHGEIQAKSAKVEKIAADHSQQQWGYAVKGARDAIGTLTATDDNAMLKQVEKLGFSEKELKSRFADPRFLHAIYKAAKWDALQGGKVKALESVRNAPPVIKPGSSDPAMSAKMQNLNWAKQIKNASSTKERVALAESRMTRFFGK